MLAQVVCGGLVLVAGTAVARADSFEDLQGKSIVYSYRDHVEFPNGNIANNAVDGKIYVDPAGRVFFRHRGSSHFGRNGSEHAKTSFDTMGDRDGNGDGRRTNYQWMGSGFSRSWMEHGARITQSIAIEGGRCQMNLQRDNFPGQVTARSGNRRIVSENVLK